MDQNLLLICGIVAGTLCAVSVFCCVGEHIMDKCMELGDSLGILENKHHKHHAHHQASVSDTTPLAKVIEMR